MSRQASPRIQSIQAKRDEAEATGESVTCRAGAIQDERADRPKNLACAGPRPGIGPLSSLRICRFNLLDERVDVARSELASEFGHMMLAVSDDVAEIICGRGTGLPGEERWSTEMPALGVVAVTFGATLLVDGIRRETGSFPGLLLRKGNGAQKCQEKEDSRDGFQGWPHLGIFSTKSLMQTGKQG